MRGGGLKKPRSQLQDRRQGRHTGIVLAFMKPDEPPPEIPAGRWLGSTKALWASFWAAPIAQLVDRVADLGRLQRWILYVDEWSRLMRSFRRERMVKGSRGQNVVSPMLQAALALEAKIAEVEARFGLTPSDRMRLGISFGEAHRSLKDLNADLDVVADEEYALPADFQPPAPAKANRKKARRRGAAS